ncbi:SIS domain-containing protein [Roseibium sp. RKSG952]|nr:SIS domain-containing protein [Roseibium sp. RKSG952]
MRSEIQEIPDAVDRLLTEGSDRIETAAAAIRALDPRLIVTVARGSSDHACTYLKYAAELLLGIPVASIGPSIASIYKAPLRLDRAVCIAVSQSGKSPDILDMTHACARDGALTVALTNNADAPLAHAAHHPLSIHAGPELSVAATKTFVTSAAAGLLLLARIGQDAPLEAALRALPGQLAQAVQLDWPEVRSAIGPHESLYTLGRGVTLAVSDEAALKFKETSQLHAESYSSAEVLHGPVSIVASGFPVLGFAAGDAAEHALAETADLLTENGAQVFATSTEVKKARAVDHVRSYHALLDPLLLIASFYSMIEAFAVSHGIDPDHPRFLKKVTQTR